MLSEFNLLGSNFVCDRRNTHPPADEYVTPKQIATDQQPQYDTIQLDQRRGSAAGDYTALNRETLKPSQHEYDVIRLDESQAKHGTDTNAAEYVDLF